MASQVTIIGPTARRHVVKTTPGTYLNDVLEEACTKLHLDAKKYGLKNNGKVVDLSRTMRLSGLTPGAKLELTLLSRSPSVVSVALQLPETEAGVTPGGRMLDKFPSTTTLWLILRKFEAGVAGQAGQPKNFTARGVPKIGAGNSGSGRLYHETPVLQIMGREYATLTDLQRTLGQLGFNNGSVLLRLSFRATETPLEDAVQQMEQYFTSVEEDTSPVATRTENKVEPQQAEQVQEDVSMDSSGLESWPETEPEVAALPEGPKPPESSDNANSNPSTATAKPSSPAAIPGVSARPTSVYSPPSSTIPHAARISHNPADYIPTVDHAKAHQSVLSKAGVNKRLPTDAELAAQEAAQADKLASVSEVSIKVRFPDQSSVVAPFSSSDTTDDLFAYARSLMAREKEPFGLQYTGQNGTRTLSAGKQKLIADLGMMNRVLVVVYWEDGASEEARKGSILKEEVMKKQQEIEVKEIQGVVANEAEDTVEVKKDSDGKGKGKSKGGVPRWLKLPGKK